MTLKTCPVCQTEYPKEMFPSRPNAPDGCGLACRNCDPKGTARHIKTCIECQAVYACVPAKQRFCSIKCCSKASQKYLINEEGRVCPRCEKFHVWADHYFHNRKASAGGPKYDTHCKSCRRLDVTEKLYDFYKGQREDLIEQQGGRCDGCLRPFGPDVTKAVDHCHVSDVVRSVLCRNCNTADGQLPTLEIMESAAQYLERHHARHGVTPPPLPD